MIHTQTVEETIAQYVQAWNETEPAQIKAAIEKCWDANATYADVRTPMLKGFDAITALILQSHIQSPLRTFKLLAPPEHFNNGGRFRWVLVRPGLEDHDGMDFFEYNGRNLITRIVGFINPLA